MTTPPNTWKVVATKATPASPYLTAAEAAAYLRVSRRGLESLVARGRLKKLPGHRHYRFTQQQLDAYLHGS